ncbi:hypothetical protein GCM10027285_08720 [Oleiagrimonas citrea]
MTMLSRSKLNVVMLAAALALPLFAHAHGHGHGHGHDHDHGKIHVALWGDQFYADDPAVQAAQENQTIDSLNDHDLDFTIFVGDTKNGHSLCTNQAIGQDVVNRFDRVYAPTIYSLGDNEWTDCHRTSNGGYDPLERLAYLRKTFFSKNVSQGLHPMRVDRQGAPGKAYSENSRFIRDRVMFVSLNVIGSNNNFVATDKECTKKSMRTAADCAAATAEYRARNAANLQWLADAFAVARKRHLAGVVIAIQADMYGGIDVADGNYKDTFLPTLDPSYNGFADFFHAMIDETQNFDGQVVLVHGDSHYFRVDKAMVKDNGQTQPNFTRVEVFGNADNSWVEMTVDPDSKNVFSFQPVFLQ